MRHYKGWEGMCLLCGLTTWACLIKKRLYSPMRGVKKKSKKVSSIYQHSSEACCGKCGSWENRKKKINSCDLKVSYVVHYWSLINSLSLNKQSSPTQFQDTLWTLEGVIPWKSPCVVITGKRHDPSRGRYFSFCGVTNRRNFAITNAEILTSRIKCPSWKPRPCAPPSSRAGWEFNSWMPLCKKSQLPP